MFKIQPSKNKIYKMSVENKFKTFALKTFNKYSETVVKKEGEGQQWRNYITLSQAFLTAHFECTL